MMTMPPTTSDSADDADQHHGDARGGLLEDSEDRVGGEHAEVVGLRRLEPPLDPQRHPGLVHGRARPASASRGFTISCSDCRAPNSFWNGPSGMTTNSSSDWPKTAPFFSLTPTTRKWHAGDPDRSCRADRARRTAGRRSASRAAPPARLRAISIGRDQPAPLGVEGGELEVLLASRPAPGRSRAPRRDRRRGVWVCACGHHRPAPTRRTPSTASASSSVTQRVVAHPLEVVLVLRDAHPLDGERVGAEVRHDRVADTAAFSPWMSDTTAMIDDDGDDVAEHASGATGACSPRWTRSASRIDFEELRHAV